MQLGEAAYYQIEQSADQLVRQEQCSRTSTGLPPLPTDLEGRLRNVFLAFHLLSKTGQQEATLFTATSVLSQHWNPRWHLYEDQDYQRVARMALCEHRRLNPTA